MSPQHDPVVVEQKLRALGATDADLDAYRGLGISVLGAWKLFQKFMTLYKMAKDTGLLDKLLKLLEGVGDETEPSVLPQVAKGPK